MTLTLNDIDNFTVRDFWSYGYTPSKYEVLPDYYVDYLQNRGICLIYTQYQEYLQAVDLSYMKYLEVDVDGDTVCLFYKCVYMANRIKFHDFPVSKSGNIENEKRLVRLLLSKSFVTSIVVDKERLLSFNIANVSEKNRCYMTDNFYKDLPYFENLFTHRYKNRYKIDILEKHISDTTYESGLDYGTKVIIENIFQDWRSTHVGRTGKDFLKAINYNSDNTCFRVFYYDDDPIAVSMLLDYDKFSQGIFRYNKSRWDYPIEKKKSLNRLDFYTEYLDLKYLYSKYGDMSRRLYVLGSGNKSKNDSLYWYKDRTSSGFIKYYEIKEKDLV